MNLDQLTRRIQQTHEALQNYAVKAINIGLTLRNWLIGYYIVEYEQKGEDRVVYGKTLMLPPSILGTLSQELQTIDNKNSVVDEVKLLSNLSFSHFAELIKIEDPLKRSFYEIECIKGTWGVRELRRQINSLFFERIGLSKSPKKLINLTQLKTDKINVDEIIKSPFTFEFLGLKAKEVVEELKGLIV